MTPGGTATFGLSPKAGSSLVAFTPGPALRLMLPLCVVDTDAMRPFLPGNDLSPS